MASDSEVRVRVRVEGIAQAHQQIAALKTTSSEAGKASEEAGKSAAKSRLGWAKAAAGAVLAYKGYQFIKSSVSTTEELAKSTAAFSRVTGLSSAESQAWVTTAKSRGIQSKQLQMGMVSLGRGLGGTGKLSKASAEAFDQLGLSASALARTPMAGRMEEIADAFHNLGPGVDQAALAQKLFGRSGLALLPILGGGAAAMNEQLKRANELVPPLEGGGKAALDSAKKQREFNESMEGLKTAVGTAAIPILDLLAETLVPIISGFSQIIAKSPPLQVALFMAAAAFTAAWAAATLGASLLVEGIVAGIAALIALLVTLYTKCSWFRNAVNAIWEAIKTVVGAVVGFIIEHWEYFVIFLLGPVLGPLFYFRSTVVSIFEAIGHIGIEVVSWIVTAFTNFITFISEVPGKIAAFAAGMFNSVKEAASSAANFVSGKISAIVSFFTSLPGRVGAALSTFGQTVTGIFSAAFSGLIGIMKAPINWVIQGLNRIHISLPGWIGKIPGLGGLAGASFGIHIPELASGGVMASGGLAMVGERGPEIAAFPTGASVMPLSSGGGLGIEVPVYLDGRQIALALGNYAAGKQAAR